ncbi:hypothetical protein RHMOL_Rhmol04G0137100 [Rhododendron molle]|uniref:Uncharacterized protein n=1 Tax=Rhododendron molle TaxID=49168 RepID=A0ACC0P1X3_RHOML|nr:hypothetical protein RHMOL_Rhmol04G0137100 [Rhododendron molle]
MVGRLVLALEIGTLFADFVEFLYLVRLTPSLTERFLAFSMVVSFKDALASTCSDFVEVLQVSCFGGAVPYKPVEDIAFAVARFFQRGGTVQTYYVDFLDNLSGATSKDVHKAIKLCEQAMVALIQQLVLLVQIRRILD